MMSPSRYSTSLGCALALALMALGAGSAAADEAMVPEVRPAVLAGYLPHAALPDSLALLPAPPAEGSAALALDQETNRGDLALQGTARWRLAGMDANLGFPWAAGDFACALDTAVPQADTPRLYQLLRRAMSDAGAATGAAKDKYQRARPFMANKQPTCTPGAEESLAHNGSYPSGHTSIGWTWALILSEIAPEQSDAILARGRAFGQSRLICNAHWDSDVIEGRFVAAGVVARLHADPTFRADLDQAKGELAAARAKALPPNRDCAAEDAALALSPPSAP
jgi:acid phosphatase (class A)